MMTNVRAGLLALHVASVAFGGACNKDDVARRDDAQLSPGVDSRSQTKLQKDNQVSIKVIIEFRAKHGKRDALHRSLQALVEDQGSSLEGYLGSTRYEVANEPDLLVEIAEWETVEARAKHLEDAKATGAFASVFELLDGPPRATILRDFPEGSSK